MKQAALTVFALTVIAVSLLSADHLTQPAARPFAINVLDDGFVEIDQDQYRKIYFQPRAVTALSAFAKGERNLPALKILIGAKEFRLDCESYQQAIETAKLIRGAI